MKAGNLPVKVDKRTLTIVFLGAVLVFAAYWFLARPTAAKLESEIQRSQVLSQEVAKANARAKQLESGVDPLADLQKVVVKSDTLLPAAPDKIQLVTSLAAMTSRHNLEVTQLDPGAPAPAGVGGLQSIPFTVSVSGSYQGITGWLGELRKGPNLYTFSGANLTGGGGESSSYTLSGTLQAWYSTTPPLAAAKAPAAPAAANPAAPAVPGSAPAPSTAVPGSMTPADPAAPPAPGTVPGDPVTPAG